MTLNRCSEAVGESSIPGRQICTELVWTEFGDVAIVSKVHRIPTRLPDVVLGSSNHDLLVGIAVTTKVTLVEEERHPFAKPDSRSFERCLGSGKVESKPTLGADAVLIADPDRLAEQSSVGVDDHSSIILPRPAIGDAPRVKMPM
jgi:hypothetical protein